MFIHLHTGLIASLSSNKQFLRQQFTQITHFIPCGKEFLYDLSSTISSWDWGGSRFGRASSSGARICLIPAQFISGFGWEGCVTATTERCLPLLLAHGRTLDNYYNTQWSHEGLIPYSQNISILRKKIYFSLRSLHPLMKISHYMVSERQCVCVCINAKS